MGARNIELSKAEFEYSYYALVFYQRRLELESNRDRVPSTLLPVPVWDEEGESSSMSERRATVDGLVKVLRTMRWEFVRRSTRESIEVFLQPHQLWVLRRALAEYLNHAEVMLESGDAVRAEILFGGGPTRPEEASPTKGT